MNEETKSPVCPWCGAAMEPVCERYPLRVGWRKRITFADVYMRCPQCKAQGPKVESVINEDEGLLAAAELAAGEEIAKRLEDARAGIVDEKDLREIYGDEWADRLGEALVEGRVSVWPCPPGGEYWHISAGGAPKGKVTVNLLRREFRVGMKWGPDDYARKDDAVAAIQRRWPGIRMAEAKERVAVTCHNGTQATAEVPNGNLTGEAARDRKLEETTAEPDKD